MPDDEALILPDADGVDGPVCETAAGEPLPQTVAVGEGRLLDDSTGGKVVMGVEVNVGARDCESEKEITEVAEGVLNPLLELEEAASRDAEDVSQKDVLIEAETDAM